MSSKQEDFGYHLIPPDADKCSTNSTLPANSGGQCRIQIHRVLPCSETWLPKLQSINDNLSLRMQSRNVHACKVLGITAIIILIAIVGSILAAKCSNSAGTILGSGLRSSVKESHILHNNATSKRMILLNVREIDFVSIPLYIEELEINSLLLINPSTPKVEKNENIRTLIISCPISELWIEFLLTIFPEVESLYLNEDRMCGFRGLALPVNENQFPVMSLPNLSVLKISDANGECPLTERIFSKWTLNNLKHLSFTQSTFDIPYCSIVNNFLAKTKSTIESLEIRHSVIAKECDFVSNIDYQKLQKLTISRSDSSSLT